MKKSWEISPRRLLCLFVGWLAATNILIGLAHSTGWLPFQALAFVCVSLMPGLALLRIMRIVLRTYSATLLYSFGLSVLVLMLSGLAANQILHVLGVQRPLELPGILGTWDVLSALLIAAGTYVNRQPLRLGTGQDTPFPKAAWLLLVLSIGLPFGAAIGAFRLNNGSTALFAELTLCYAAGLIIYAFLLRARLPDGLLAWLVFMLGLTILFMTSLRGWDITGHDIEREFRVYTLTQMHGRWNIALNRDPYNACLSITVLPQVFAKLLNISGLTVFKVVSQVIFAACPVAVYVLLRQYISKLAALAGALLFICYPTFINDSAMLTRQGIAYFFFVLALLVISNRAQKARYKTLFSLCAVGAVLSHYSTAYLFVTLFAIAVACKFCVVRLQHKPGKAFRVRLGLPREQKTVLSVLFAAVLMLMTFVWYSQITATSGGLITTASQSFSAVPKMFSDDNRSSDTSTALLFAGGHSEADLYQLYLTKSEQTHTPAATAAAAALPNAANYFPTLISDTMPLTHIGKRAVAIGLNPSIITTLRQNFAKVLQLLALAGVAYAAYRLLWKKSDELDVDFICLSMAGFIVLALMVVLPVLSKNYGVLRAFQQVLIFLLLPVMLLLVRIGRRLHPRVRTPLVTTSIVALFLLFTGFFAQILGGTSATLSLDNSGLYYGLYASSAADVRSFAWTKQHVPKGSDVRAANYNRALMHDPSYPFSHSGILPSQVGADTVVYLDPAQVVSHKFYTYYQSNPLIMTFPLDYYAAAKNEIYSTTSTRIYK